MDEGAQGQTSNHLPRKLIPEQPENGSDRKKREGGCTDRTVCINCTACIKCIVLYFLYCVFFIHRIHCRYNAPTEISHEQTAFP